MKRTIDGVDSPYIDLIFTIHVNGKLAVYNLEMPIVRYLGKITLKDWTIWYVIIELFHSLGYYFSEGTEQRSSVIQDWIERIYFDHEEKGIPTLE